MGWLEARGALLRQLRGVLERDGWYDDVGGYEYLRYRKGGAPGKMFNKGGIAIGCTVTPCYGSCLATTGYWVTLTIPSEAEWRPEQRVKLRRFRTPIDEDINEVKVLAKIDDLFRETM